MHSAFLIKAMPRKLAMALGAVISIRFASLIASIVATLITLNAFAATAPAAPAPRAIQDLPYGDVLFQFYQDHYFNSLTSLMVSQHFDRMQHHSDDAELLRGGILLSYGLLQEASAIFSRLIDGNSTPKARDRAYFYLAKISYQRGYNADAEKALEKIGNALPADLQEEHGLLKANLLMARGDYSDAVTALETVNIKGRGSRYVRFNLGVALLKTGDTARGIKTLTEIGRAPAESEEFRNLRDRANVALGFVALADKRPKDARAALERVRLNSMQSNKALLGFGWAAAALDDPKLALVPWRELIQRDISDSAVLEAQIAVPYAYAELGAYRQAITFYNEAIVTFKNEDIALKESIAAIRSGELVDMLVEANPGDEMGWSWSVQSVPTMPHANHLAQVMAQHEFQEAFKNYRDLLFLQKNLGDWRNKLSVFNDMLETRRKAFADRLPEVQDGATSKKAIVDRLLERQMALAKEIKAGETAADGIAFSDDKQLALAEVMRRVQQALTDVAYDKEFDAARQKARLAAGVMTWQLAQDYTNRVWQAKDESHNIDEQLAKATQSYASLKLAQQDEPVRFDAFLHRIADLAATLDVMIPRVTALTGKQREIVQSIAINELLRSQKRLADYSTQARFAVAQLYDRGAEAADKPDSTQSKDKKDLRKEGDHATKP